MLALTFLAFSIETKAQNFTYKARVQSVSKKAFYSIQLPSDLAARSQPHYEDLRLFDNDGKEIPYLLKKEETLQEESNITYYPILKNNSSKEWQVIIVQNELKNPIDKLLVELKNADANRSIRISGSNDNAQWFVVKDNFEFSAFGNSDEATQFKMLSFPKVDYEYYKIEIKNKNKNPLNIQRIGFSNSTQHTPNYQLVNGLSFTRKDSNKKTMLHFICQPANRIDKLSFRITSPELFHRNAQLVIEANTSNENSLESDMSLRSKKMRTIQYKPLHSFELIANQKNELLTFDFLGNNLTSSFDIIIENNDDQPLVFDKIQAFQLNTNLVAELKNNKSYFLYTGDSLLPAPVYDLVYFSSKISDSLSTIHAENVIPKSQKVNEEFSNSNDKTLVWIGLIIIGIILLFLTVNMLKRMNNENTSSINE